MKTLGHASIVRSATTAAYCCRIAGRRAGGDPSLP
jgi:hypothetical protein